MSRSTRDDVVVLGRIGAAYGIKGWVKVNSHTEPKQGILDYHPWLIKLNNQAWRPVKVVAGKVHGKGVIAKLEGCEDRNAAEAYRGAELAVVEDSLPQLEEGEYYWHQLEGLKVFCRDEEDREVLIGRVHHLMDTGANDVLVVKGCEGSIDNRERLLPYLLDQVVTDIDLGAGEMRVDWDPEF